MPYTLHVTTVLNPDGTIGYQSTIEPYSFAIQGVFWAWGDFLPALLELRQEALAEPFNTYSRICDFVEIKFDTPKVLHLYDMYQLDGLDPDPVVIDRLDFVAMLDKWIEETGLE